MITITAHGRLAHQPELKQITGGSVVCEFRLLSTRFSKGAEHTEAVTFFCYGEDAERFCDGSVKGQEIEATGVQETSSYTKDGQTRTFVKYRLTWFARGRKPYAGNRDEGQAGQGRAQAPSYQPRQSNASSGHRPAAQQPARPAAAPQGDAPYDDDDDWVGGDFGDGRA